MAYSKVGWENLPQQTTPLSAENFNHMDKGIADLDGRVTILEQGGGTGGVGVRSEVGINNELFNNTSSHTIENAESKNNHLEGSTNTLKKTDKTYNNDSNHIEGENNIAGGYAGHVENSYNQVHETNAHAGGKHSVASGSGSFAQGRGVIAFGTAAFTTGQSAKSGDSNVTTLVDAEIDWATQANEDEVNRAKRITAKLIDLWHNDVNFKHQFTASLGGGAMAGGVNTFVNGGSSFGHGYECEVTAQFGFVGGYQSTTLADGGFTWGVDAQTLGPQGVTFGISTRGRAKNGFVIGNHCENVTSAENSFTGGESCQSQAKNAFTFGIYSYGAAENSVAIGEGIVVGTKGQFAIGKYNNNESKALFAVGNGTSSARKNVFEVFDDYITINNTKFIGQNIVTTDSNGNITIKAGATIAPIDTGAGVGKIKFSENGFSLRITSAANTGLVFDTVGVKLTDNNYKLTSPSTDWTSYELGSDLNSLHNKVKNALTTDKANVAGGYAALDANKNINVVGMKIPCNTYPSGEAGTTNYLSNGIQSYDSQGLTISSPYYGWYIKFTPGLPGQIITNYNEIVIKNASNKSFNLYNIDSAYSAVGDPLDDPDDDATLWVNKYGSNNKWSVVRKVVNIDETKQNKPTIVTELIGTTVTLAANTEYHHISEDSAALTLTLPTTIEEDYQSYISFKSGATATTITISTFDGTLKFKGDDCTNGIFTPAANTVYEVALKCVGMDSNNKPYIVARVGAC